MGGHLGEIVSTLIPSIDLQTDEERPKKCKTDGDRYTIRALTQRETRYRLENCIIACNDRKGTKRRSRYFWNLMSQAARDANSTRELSKLTEEQQNEALKGNQSAATKPKGKRATKPNLSKPHKNKRARKISELDDNHEQDPQPSPSAFEQRTQTRSSKRRKIVQPTPSAAPALGNPDPAVMYQGIPVDPRLLSPNDSTIDPSLGVPTSSAIYPMQNLDPRVSYGNMPLNPTPQSQHYHFYGMSGVEGTSENTPWDLEGQMPPFRFAGGFDYRNSLDEALNISSQESIPKPPSFDIGEFINLPGENETILNPAVNGWREFPASGSSFYDTYDTYDTTTVNPWGGFTDEGSSRSDTMNHYFI